MILSRRRLLHTLGAGVPAVALPLLRAGPLEAAGPPIRLVVLLTSNGTILDNWRPTGSGAGQALGPILKPLERWQPRMNLIQGVHVSVTAKPTNNSPDPHAKPWGGMLTGRELLPAKTRPNLPPDQKNGFGSGVSVDQYVAQRLGDATAFPSLHLGVQVASAPIPASYAGSNQPVFPENNPFELWKRVFGGGLPGAPSSPPSPSSPAPSPSGDDAAAKRLLEERRSILDHVRADLMALMPRLPADERVRVERHLASLREIEQRLVSLRAAGDPRSPTSSSGGGTCGKPALPQELAHLDHNNFSKVADLQADIAAAALACDLTRVVVITYSGSVNQQTYPFLGLNSGHHNYSHAEDGPGTRAREQITKVCTLHAQRFAYLLDKLDSHTDGNGRTLLDNSVAMWANEVSRGIDHSWRNIPFVLVGGAGGALKTGRTIVANDKPNNDLLVSICHLMGCKDVTTFGDPDYCTGPLTELG